MQGTPFSSPVCELRIDKHVPKFPSSNVLLAGFSAKNFIFYLQSELSYATFSHHF